LKLILVAAVTDEQLASALEFQRRAQWRLDFVSSNSGRSQNLSYRKVYSKIRTRDGLEKQFTWGEENECETDRDDYSND
jgi:hypothetical protein